MPFCQIVQNALKEEKGDIEIYRFYVGLLRDCPEAETISGYEHCKTKLQEIFEI